MFVAEAPTYITVTRGKMQQSEARSEGGLRRKIPKAPGNAKREAMFKPG
jgi:hypothetical protein